MEADRIEFGETKEPAVKEMDSNNTREEQFGMRNRTEQNNSLEKYNCEIVC
jgi:hypothetical protein